MPRRTLATRARAPREEEEEETRPRRSSRRSRDEDDEADEETRPRRSSRRARDEDEDERRPRGRKKGGSREKTTRSTTAGYGYAARKKTKATKGKFDDADKFSVDEVDTKYLIKVLSDEPYCFDQHWIEEFRGEQRKMSFVCLGDDCPLCDIPYPVKDYEFWNVVDLSGAEPVVRYWEASSSPAQAIDARIRELEEKDKLPTDEDVYFVVYKLKGKNRINTYHVDKIKARDLDEEFDLDPLTSGELADLTKLAFDPEEMINFSSRKELKEIAEEIEDADD